MKLLVVITSLVALTTSLTITPAKNTDLAPRSNAISPPIDDLTGNIELSPRADLTMLTRFRIVVGRQDLGSGFVLMDIGSNFGVTDVVEVGTKGHYGAPIAGIQTKGAVYQTWCDVNGGGPNGLNECAVGRSVCVEFKGVRRCGYANLDAPTEAECTAMGKLRNSPVNCRASLSAKKSVVLLKE